MSPWIAILLGLALIYTVVGSSAYFAARTDTRYSDRYRKENARHTMFTALMDLTIFLVIVAIGITAIMLVGYGVLNLIDPYGPYHY